MSYIDSKEIIPKNKEGLENYKFVTPFENFIYVYRLTTISSPFIRPNTPRWLCCTDGWMLMKWDGRWHERVTCGNKPDRVADAIDDIFECYRDKN